MAIETQLKAGDYTFKVTAENERDLIEQVSFLSCIPAKCPGCGQGECGASVRLHFRTPQDFRYYSMKCTGTPAHEKVFGQSKKGGILFDYDNKPWVLAMSSEEWDKRAQGGPGYKCEICGTSDNSAHRPDCPNDTRADQVNQEPARQRPDNVAPETKKAEPGKKMEPIDENGSIIDAQLARLQKIYDDNDWPHVDFKAMSFKTASQHIRDCEEAVAIRKAAG